MEREGSQETLFSQPDESTVREELEGECKTDKMKGRTTNIETNIVIELPAVDSTNPAIVIESEHKFSQATETDQDYSLIKNVKNNDIEKLEATKFGEKVADSLNVAEQKQYTLSNLQDFQHLLPSNNETTNDLFRIDIAKQEGIYVHFSNSEKVYQNEIVTKNNVGQVNLHTDQVPSTSRQASINEQIEMNKSVLISSNEAENCASQMRYDNPEQETVLSGESLKPSISLSCGICGYVALSTKELRKHLNEYHYIQTYECDFCEMLFRTIIRLREHIKDAHTNERFLCCFCLAKYSALSNLKDHKRYYHRGRNCESPCRICEENNTLHQRFLKK